LENFDAFSGCNSDASVTLLPPDLLPGENGWHGIVPDRSHNDAGKAGDPPNLVPGKDIAGDADIRDGAKGADRIEGEEPAHRRQTVQAPASLVEEIVGEEIRRHSRYGRRRGGVVPITKTSGACGDAR
jgi:hypothetical protein